MRRTQIAVIITDTQFRVRNTNVKVRKDTWSSSKSKRRQQALQKGKHYRKARQALQKGKHYRKVSKGEREGLNELRLISKDRFLVFQKLITYKTKIIWKGYKEILCRSPPPSQVEVT